MIDTAEEVILVDESDREIGTGPKLGTHRDGLLHRAFSIFLFNERGETLIQQRADIKYHSPRKWANTCCGHPRPGETVKDAAGRRLGEELGLDIELSFGFHARYQTVLEAGMTENEFVYIYGGLARGTPRPEPTEVADWTFISLEKLRDAHGLERADQTIWLQHYLDKHFDALVSLRDRITSA